MMRKFLYQTSLSVLVFAAVLFAFSRVDWMGLFGLSRNSVEQRLGALYWELFSDEELFVDDAGLTAPLDSLFGALCAANGICRDSVSLHLAESEEVNAYACPGGHLVVYTALVAACQSEAELCGVLAHELAHLERGHVMQKLVKEIGLAALATMSDAGSASEVLRVLSSTAYDRTLEAEADEVAVAYLLRAGIDPRPFGDFLLRLAEEEADLPSLAEWISTHPDSEKRAHVIYSLAGRGVNGACFRSLMPAGEWEAYRARFEKWEYDDGCSGY